MKYPTTEDVKKASKKDLIFWYKYLPYPGTNAFRKMSNNFGIEWKNEQGILYLIINRLKDFNINLNDMEMIDENY